MARICKNCERLEKELSELKAETKLHLLHMTILLEADIARLKSAAD